MLLCKLITSVLGNMLAGKRFIQACERALKASQGQGTIRDAQDF